jgi:hypothetical protein
MDSLSIQIEVLRDVKREIMAEVIENEEKAASVCRHTPGS